MRRPKPSPYQHMVQQLPSGRWIVAVYEDFAHQWRAWLTLREMKARKMAVNVAFARTLDELDAPTYATSEGAFRRAHKLFEMPWCRYV